MSGERRSEPLLPGRPDPRVGVVGLGLIGGGVAVRLARRGRTPAVYDIRPDAVAALEGVPNQLASSAEVAAVSDVVVVAVVDADQARTVIAGDRGLLSGTPPCAVIVLLSTVAIAVVHELAAVCADAGVAFLDCGVTQYTQADGDQLVAMVGGPDDTVSYALPVFEDFAKAVVHCGPLGSGMVTKIARNVVTYGSWRAVYEASLLAQMAGVDSEKLIAVIDEADPDGSTLLMLLRLQLAGQYPPDMAERVGGLMDKDLAAAQELASEVGCDAPAIDVARSNGRATLHFAPRRGSDS